MLSYKLDFSSCVIISGFGKSSNKYLVVVPAHIQYSYNYVQYIHTYMQGNMHRIILFLCKNVHISNFVPLIIYDVTLAMY